MGTKKENSKKQILKKQIIPTLLHWERGRGEVKN